LNRFATVQLVIFSPILYFAVFHRAAALSREEEG
jgi:hypothetical protein